MRDQKEEFDLSCDDDSVYTFIIRGSTFVTSRAKGARAMNNQKIMRFLFILVPALLVLTIFWNSFAPFLSIALVYLMLLVIRSGWLNRVLGKPHEPTVYYRPTTEPSIPTAKHEPPPRKNPPLNFDLTAQEYQQLAKTYQQGYQAPVPQHPSTIREEDAKPKQDHPLDYDQPYAQYPELMPPII